MLLSDFQFKLLKYIYKHPYVDGESLKLSYMLFKHRRYTDRHFINALEFLCRSGYIDCTFFKSAEEDTGQRVQPDIHFFTSQTSLELLRDGIFVPREKSIYNEHYHYLATESGARIVQEEHTVWFRTWVPWGVTAIIAFASLLTAVASCFISYKSLKQSDQQPFYEISENYHEDES